MNTSQQTPPVSQGDEIDVRIESVGGKGDGVAKVKGFVLFIPGTSKGETCRVKITKVLPNNGFATKIGPAKEPVESSSSSQPKDEFADIDLENLGEGSENFGEED